MSYFIQIGAGAGDLDERLDFKDGFTKFVKGNLPKWNPVLSPFELSNCVPTRNQRGAVHVWVILDRRSFNAFQVLFGGIDLVLGSHSK